MANDPNLFKACFLKLERADEHIEQLDLALRAFHGSNPYEMIVEKDVDTGYRHVKLRRLKPLPGSLPLIASDAIHNIRCSLDYLACDLALRNGAGDTDGVYFPFAKSAQAFHHATVQRKVAKLRPSDRAVIERLKPYRGGNDLLWALNDMDRSDKHVELVALSPLAAGLGLKPKPGQVDVEVRVWQPHPFNDAGEMLLCSFPPDTNFEGEIQPSINICFAQPEPVKNEPLGGTINYFRRMAEEIIRMF